MTKDILLTTLNSSYPHSSFGLRYLYANLGDLQERTQIIEYTIQRNAMDIAENLLSFKPKIIGIGVYIWNSQESLELVSLLKRISPDTIVVLGGPEVTHESESQQICKIADFTIKGEADFLFREFCEKALLENVLPEKKFISGDLPDIKAIKAPYAYYSDEDIKNRVIYVEVSRGCPYRCEYCLSSLDKAVRSFDINEFLGHIQTLIDRGTRQFKFIDRTFNLSPTTCTQILEFFLARIDLGLFLHFEMVPDRLPTEIRELIKKFPHGALQFEIGIQTWNPEVAKNVSRRNDLEKVKDNFKFLRQDTGVHTHADLIVGLPGENVESFGKGFDVLAGLDPDEIQVGILKRLKGAPIARHDFAFQMVYADHPPFQILRTKDIDFEWMQKMNRFAKYWDLYANSGNFKKFTAYIKSQATESFFWEFFNFSEYLSKRFSQNYGISLNSLFEAAFNYLKEVKGFSFEEARDLLTADYLAPGNRDLPRFLKYDLAAQAAAQATHAKNNVIPKRQQRHLSTSTT